MPTQENLRADEGGDLLAKPGCVVPDQFRGKLEFFAINLEGPAPTDSFPRSVAVELSPHTHKAPCRFRGMRNQSRGGPKGMQVWS